LADSAGKTGNPSRGYDDGVRRERRGTLPAHPASLFRDYVGGLDRSGKTVNPSRGYDDGVPANPFRDYVGGRDRSGSPPRSRRFGARLR
jgi:hypothetical protein